MKGYPLYPLSNDAQSAIGAAAGDFPSMQNIQVIIEKGEKKEEWASEFAELCIVFGLCHFVYREKLESN